MQIQHNVPLSSYSTMRLGGPAAHLAEVHSPGDIAEALTFAQTNSLPVIMIGTGSNIVWRDEGFPGLVLVNKIAQYEVLSDDELSTYLTVGGGEPWDSVVARTVLDGYSGVEQLSLIPGTAGAAPVQNIGAYGRELSEVLMSVQAYDKQAMKLVNIPTADCGFGYRTSRFKTVDKNRFFITAITLHLTRTPPQPPFYASLNDYLNEHNITTYTSQTIRDAVIAIRNAKLPNPANIANNGSFFTNPIIEQFELQELRDSYPLVVYWPRDDGKVKISAAWLIEQAGFKAYQDKETGMAIWPGQSLVFINENAKSTADLLKFKQKIVDGVKAKFGITLVQEPELI